MKNILNNAHGTVLCVVMASHSLGYAAQMKSFEEGILQQNFIEPTNVAIIKPVPVSTWQQQVLNKRKTSQDPQRAELDNNFLESARGGYLDEVENFVKDGADINFKNRRTGVTALMVAIPKHIHIVEYLIRLGAQVDLQDYEKTTALILAARSDRIDILEIILKAGADCTLKDSMGWTAFDYAANRFNNNISIVKALMDADMSGITVKESPTLKHILEPKPIDENDQLAQLIKAKLDSLKQQQIQKFMNWRTDFKELRAPEQQLFEYAQAGNLAGVIESVASGISINVRDQNGHTPLMRALAYGHHDVVKFFLRKLSTQKLKASK